MNGDDASRLLEARTGAELLVHELEAVGGQLPRSHLLLLRLLQEAGRHVLCHHDECCCAGVTRQHSPGGCRSWEQRRRREGAREERERGEGHDVQRLRVAVVRVPRLFLARTERRNRADRPEGRAVPCTQNGRTERLHHTCFDSLQFTRPGFTTCVCPLKISTISAVWPSSPFLLTDAPWSSSSFTNSVWPLELDFISAVQPSSSCSSIDAP